MRITVPFRFTESVIPPRCRKPRPVMREDGVSLNIREISADRAPVAIHQHGRDWIDADGPLVDVTTEYRWWNGKLWSLYRNRERVGAPLKTQTADEFAAASHADDYYYASTWSRQKRIDELRSWARTILFIDGLRYEQPGEPRYVVMTYGLGCNHGLGWGTSLSTDNHYNPNIGKTRYFRVDQFEEAVAAATRIALGRGDTKAVPIVENQRPDTFEILIPEAVRLRPNKDHGNGDPFLNRAEAVISGLKDPGLSGFALMALACKA